MFHFLKFLLQDLCTYLSLGFLLIYSVFHRDGIDNYLAGLSILFIFD